MDSNYAHFVTKIIMFSKGNAFYAMIWSQVVKNVLLLRFARSVWKDSIWTIRDATLVLSFLIVLFVRLEINALNAFRATILIKLQSNAWNAKMFYLTARIVKIKLNVQIVVKTMVSINKKHALCAHS